METKAEINKNIEGLWRTWKPRLDSWNEYEVSLANCDDDGGYLDIKEVAKVLKKIKKGEKVFATFDKETRKKIMLQDSLTRSWKARLRFLFFPNRK
jgi:hypothetical protein